MTVSLVLSITMLALVLLVLGGIALLRRGERRKGVLMLVLAGVVAMNVALWTIPTQSGVSPADRLGK